MKLISCCSYFINFVILHTPYTHTFTSLQYTCDGFCFFFQNKFQQILQFYGYLRDENKNFTFITANGMRFFRMFSVSIYYVRKHEHY